MEGKVINGLKLEGNKTEMTIKPFQCNKCNGFGKVSQHSLDSESILEEAEIVRCTTCNGKGIIWR